MQYPYKGEDYDNRAKCEKKDKKETKEKILTTDFKTGKADYLSSQPLYQDPRGVHVIKDSTTVPTKGAKSEMTMGEQLFFKRDFKKSEKVWKPNSHIKTGKVANFQNEKYKENGPEEKVKKSSHGIWV